MSCAIDLARSGAAIWSKCVYDRIVESEAKSDNALRIEDENARSNFAWIYADVGPSVGVCRVCPGLRGSK
jgi:hypothetical protein